MSTVEILKAARALIATPEKWCQGHIGHLPDGTPISWATDLDDGIIATDYCAYGAIRAAARSYDAAMLPSDALSRLTTGAPFAGNYGALDWNNAPERTHTEVLAAFDRAIANEEAKAQEFTVDVLDAPEAVIA